MPNLCFTCFLYPIGVNDIILLIVMSDTDPDGTDLFDPVIIRMLKSILGMLLSCHQSAAIIQSTLDQRITGIILCLAFQIDDHANFLIRRCALIGFLLLHGDCRLELNVVFDLCTRYGFIRNLNLMIIDIFTVCCIYRRHFDIGRYVLQWNICVFRNTALHHIGENLLV